MLLILRALSLLGIVEFEGKFDRAKIKNRSYIFVEEAQKRNIPIKAVKLFCNYNGEYVFTFGRKEYRYTGTPLSLFVGRKLDVDDKVRVKRILSKHNLPVSKGKSFWSKSRAIEYGRELGFPVVVKPNRGSLSHHVTVNVRTEAELISAIQIAKDYQPEIIVEKFVPGNLYRATVINYEKVYICRKDLASIVGDDVSSVEKLIETKNREENRGGATATLQKIEASEDMKNLLVLQGLKFDSIVPSGQKILLAGKYTLASGCDIVNVKEQTNHKTLEMFLEASKVLGQPLIGFDFICPDISKPFDEQDCAIIEANGFPYLDMHQVPSAGWAEPVAKDVWDVVLNQLSADK